MTPTADARRAPGRGRRDPARPRRAHAQPHRRCRTRDLRRPRIPHRIAARRRRPRRASATPACSALRDQGRAARRRRRVLRARERGAAARAASPPDEAGALEYCVARRAERPIPGYLPLFAALTGEASTPRHPAHERMRARYAELRDAVDRRDRGGDPARGGRRRPRSAGRGDPHLGGVGRAAAARRSTCPIASTSSTMLEEHEGMLALPVGWREPDGRCADRAPRRRCRRCPTSLASRRRRTRSAGAAATASAASGARGSSPTRRHSSPRRATATRACATSPNASACRSRRCCTTTPRRRSCCSAVLAERDRGIQSRDSYAPRRPRRRRAACPPAGRRRTPHRPRGSSRCTPCCRARPCRPTTPRTRTSRTGIRETVDHFAALFRAAQEDGDLPAHRDPELRGGSGSPRCGTACSTSGSTTATRWMSRPTSPRTSTTCSPGPDRARSVRKVGSVTRRAGLRHPFPACRGHAPDSSHRAGTGTVRLRHVQRVSQRMPDEKPRTGRVRSLPGAIASGVPGGLGLAGRLRAGNRRPAQAGRLRAGNRRPAQAAAMTSSTASP